MAKEAKVSFILVTPNPRRAGQPNCLVCPQRLIDPDGLWRALVDFSSSWASNTSDSLTALWYEEAARALDLITPEQPWSCHQASWFTKEL